MIEQNIDELVKQKMRERMVEIGRKGGLKTSPEKKKASLRNIKKAQRVARQLARQKPKE